MANYLIKSSLCLLVLLVFYHLFLEREKMHKFNRFYLLGSVLFSFCAPLFVIYVEATQIPVEIIQSIPLQDSFEIVESQPTIIFEEKFDYSLLLYGFYALVTLFLLTRFFKNIINIFLRIKHHTKIKINNATIVLLNDDVIPHTFWNYIFISKKEYENKNFNKELLTHELTHVAQYHTLDILCIELLKIVFWFNPLLYILKRLLQLNHEFLADEKVIKEHKNISNYQSLLLEKSLHATSYQLTSNLNYLVTKKRLTMMTKRINKYSWLKQLAIAPLLAGLFFVFAERVEAQEINEFNKQNLNDIVLEAYQEYGFRNTYFSTKDEKNNTIKVPFTLLNNKKDVGPPEPLILKKKIMSNEFFNRLTEEGLDKIIFINNVNVSFDELEKYSPSDFSYYSWNYANYNSKINRYMKHYFLETPEYFEIQNKKRKKEFLDFLEKRKKLKINEKAINELVLSKSQNFHIESYVSLYNNYESRRNEKPHFLEKTKEDKQNLINRYTFLEEQYSKLSSEDKKKVKKPINPFYPYKKLIKDDKVFYKFGNELIEESQSIAQKPTQKQNSNLADFNIKIEKIGSTFKLKCTKGCDWEELTFNLNENESKTVDKFGAGNKTDYSSNFKILVKNIENAITNYTFTVESLKGTNWLNKSKLYTKNKTEITQYLF